MKISIVDLQKGPREIEFVDSPGDLLLEAEAFSFPAPVTGTARFQLFGKRVLMRGRLETTVQTACIRCLEPTELSVQSKIELVFEPRPQTDEDEGDAEAAEWEAQSREIDFYDEETVDPSDSLRQLVLLQLPDYPLCGDACLGLCAQCGANRNTGSCECEKNADAATDEPDWKARLKKIELT